MEYTNKDLHCPSGGGDANWDFLFGGGRGGGGHLLYRVLFCVRLFLAISAVVMSWIGISQRLYSGSSIVRFSFRGTCAGAGPISSRSIRKCWRSSLA